MHDQGDVASDAFAAIFRRAEDGSRVRFRLCGLHPRDEIAARSIKTAAAAVKYVFVFLATEEHNDVGEQSDDREKYHHEGLRAGSSRTNHEVPKSVDDTSGREFTCPGEQEWRSNTEDRQQRQDEADSCGDSSHLPHSAVGCSLDRQPIQRRLDM
jgi:hypothetical protein